MRTRLVLALAAGLVPAGCTLVNTGPSLPTGPGSGVLFIGNSYTYVNDVPGLVKALSDSSGNSFDVTTVAEPDWALVEHWFRGSARGQIARGGWDMVILQQGPSAVEVNRDSLRLLTSLFAPEIKRGGAKVGLFSAWPQSVNRADFPRAIESYQLAASDVDGIFLPVASAWLAAWRLDPDLPLYAGDGLHASVQGSYLTALVIHTMLTNKTPIGLPARLGMPVGQPLSIDPEVALLLQQAAYEVTLGTLTKR